MGLVRKKQDHYSTVMDRLSARFTLLKSSLSRYNYKCANKYIAEINKEMKGLERILNAEDKKEKEAQV